MANSAKHRQILVAEEVTYGTAPGSIAEDVGLVQEVTPSATSNVQQIYTIGSIHAQDIANLRTVPKVDLTYIMQHGRFLKYLLGDVLTETTTTGDTSHTWAAATMEKTPPSMTMQIGDVATATATRTYTGGIVSSMTLGLTKENLLTGRASCLFQDATLSTAASAQVISTLVPLKSFQGFFKIGGSAVGETQSWEITIDRKGNALESIGSRKPDLQALNEINISGKVSIGFGSNTQYTNFLGGSSISSTQPTAMTIDLGADNGTVLGSGQRNINLNLTSCQFSEISDPSTLGEFIYVDVSFTGKLNTAVYIDNIAAY